jgi:hypothetical protein
MKKVKLFEEYEAMGKYNTVAKVIKAIGRRPSDKKVAEFIVANFKDVTGEEFENSTSDGDDKIADIVGFYKIDTDTWPAIWDKAFDARK